MTSNVSNKSIISLNDLLFIIEEITTNTFGLSTISISGLKLNQKFDVETYAMPQTEETVQMNSALLDDVMSEAAPEVTTLPTFRPLGARI